MKLLYLVDASSMFFRAHYAVKTPLQTKEGFPTGALYGFFQMTIKLLKENSPDYIAYLFDRKEPSFRKEIFADYKANRTAMPPELEQQVPYLRQITDSLGIPSFDKLGYEADDLIGVISNNAKETLKVVIISGDKDFAQLIGPNISMWDTMRDIRYDRDAVVEKWGVSPEQMIDYLAICGDSSDNIPGVYGIGAKGAAKLLAQFKSLEDIYDNLDKVKNEKLKQKLIEGKDSAFLSKTLVTIKTNIQGFEVTTSDLKQRDVDQTILGELLKKLEFKFFEKTLFGTPKKQKFTVLDFKKESLNAGDTVWGFVYQDLIVIGKDKSLYKLQVEDKDNVTYLENLNLSWRGFDPKSLFREIGFTKPQKVAWSSNLVAYSLESGHVGSFNELYRIYINEELPTLPNIEDLYDAHLKLASFLEEKLENSSTKNVYFEIELPLIPVLFDMEINGILLDADYLKDQSVKLEKKIQSLEAEIYKLSGYSFNVSSPKQLAKFLFEDLELPIVKKKKSGPSTDSSVLEVLSNHHPIINHLIEYREISKLKSTYVDVLPTLVDKSTGRIHTHFRQASVITGRLSSVNPNLQNIPIKTARGKGIRKAFIAPRGFKLVSADYSQIELRLLAHITDDEGLKNAFYEDRDIHATTASELFNVDIDDVSEEQRRVAKSVNFGLAYGQTSFGLSNVIKVSKPEAQKIIDSYFAKFPKVEEYMINIVEEARKNGYVETLFGRRRLLPDINASNKMKQRMAERAAINMPLQGSASDVVKMAMLKIAEEQKSLKMLLQVHDELVFEIKDEDLDESINVIKDCMEQVVKLKVPLKVDIFSGQNWNK